jgi:hypothetical protein
MLSPGSSPMKGVSRAISKIKMILSILVAAAAR